jgi:small subunit ribosomal protein S17e
MGKVRTEMVKRLAIALIDKYPKSFSTDFDQNKKFLREVGLDVSKKMRNKVAGYSARLIRAEMNVQLVDGEVEPENN